MLAEELIMNPLLSYLPHHLAQDLLCQPSLNPVGHDQRFDVIALFADISGFTPMSEALARQGKNGTEELTDLVNRYFGIMIDLIHSYGGSVAKFGGDALTILFRCTTSSRKNAAQHAIQCALDMQSQMTIYQNIPTSAGNFSLAMKAGLAVGPVFCTTVGEISTRLEYVVAGSVLERSAEAEHQAQPGEVIIHNDLLPFAAQFSRQPKNEFYTEIRNPEAVAVASNSNLPFVKEVVYQPMMAGLPSPNFMGTTSSYPLTPVLAAYLHPAIASRVESGQSGFVNEHRKVTVLFVNFGDFDYDNDPQVGKKLQDYLVEVIRTVQIYDGYLKQVDMGDKGSKYIVLFGAPVAHENDEERALRCALDLRQAALVARVETKTGISTGQVFCGQVGSEVRQEYAAIGDSVNLAARLMSAAQPGQILAAGTTQRYVSERFGWDVLEPMRLKGKSEPVSVYRLTGTKRKRGLAARLGEPAYSLPMVGRKEELAQVKEVMGRVKGGQGQVVGICAEAGMGKSRLTAEVMRLANQEGMVTYGGECTSYGQNASYIAWQRILRDLFVLDERWSTESQINQIERRLRLVDPQHVARAPLLGVALNLPIGETDLTQAMDAKLRKNALETLLVDCIRFRAREMPVMLVLEDCQWIDTLSHDLLAAVGRSIANIPVLIIVVYRPIEEEAEQLLVSRMPYFKEYRLKEFNADETEQLIRLKLEQLFGAVDLLHADLIERVTERAQGNPFYIDEIVNLLRDKGIDLRNRGSLGEFELPDSLQSLIISRIDQLQEDEKITLKVASVIGRMFKASWLWGAFPELGDAEQVKDRLSRLSRLDLTSQDKPEPDLEYLFKHVVTRDVAYESLTYATRASLHEQLAQFIEQKYQAKLERWQDILAYHYGRSQNVEKQREFYRKAGDAARAVYANNVAVEYYKKLLPLVPDNEKIEVKLKLGEVWQLVGKWQDAEITYRETLALAEEWQDERGKAESQNSLGLLFYLKGLYSEALEWLEQARVGFEALGDLEKVNVAIRYMGNVSLQQGEFSQALSCYERWLKSASERGNEFEITQAIGNMGNVYMQQGAYEEALSCYKRWLRVATDVGDKQQAAATIGNMGRAYWCLGDALSALVCFEQQLLTAAEVGDQRVISIACANMGEIYRHVGNYERALACHTKQLQIALEIGNPSVILTAVGYLGSIYNAQKRFEEAERFCQRALVFGRVLKVRYYLGEFLFVNAIICARQQRYEEAQSFNEEALTIVRQVGHKEIEFKAEVLTTQMQLVLAQISMPQAIAEFEKLLKVWPGDKEQAALRYELWSLDKTQEQHRQNAARLYSNLYDNIPDMEYGQRYQKLTGKDLPESLPFPEMPEILTRNLPHLNELIEQVDYMIAQ